MYLTRITCHDLSTALKSLNTLRLSPLVRIETRSALRSLPPGEYHIAKYGKSVAVSTENGLTREVTRVWFG